MGQKIQKAGKELKLINRLGYAPLFCQQRIILTWYELGYANQTNLLLNQHFLKILSILHQYYLNILSILNQHYPNILSTWESVDI